MKQNAAFLPDLSHSSTTDASLVVERVKCFKLQGINISHDFNSQIHVDVITSKAATRLFSQNFEKIWFKPSTSPSFLPRDGRSASAVLLS